MYLGEPLQYYQSSNNLPQGAQTDCLSVNLKFCLVLTLPVALLVQSLQTCLCINLSCFVLHNTSSRSARCWLVSTVSTFFVLCCSIPQILFSLLICLISGRPSQFLLLCMLNTSTRSARPCLLVFVNFVYTFTFVEPLATKVRAKLSWFL